MEKTRQDRSTAAFRQALHNLLRQGDYLQKLDKGENMGMRLARHPFDLPLPDPNRATHMHGRHIEFFGHPGYTDESICDLLTNLGWHLPLEADGVTHLRRISAQCNPDNPHQHTVYYEIGLYQAVYMSSGCTDYSGTGGQGKVEMDGLFELLSFLYMLKVDDVEIDYTKAQSVYFALDHAISRFHSQRDYDFTASAGLTKIRQIRSECCGTELEASYIGDIIMGRCAGCNKKVARVTPTLNEVEWLDGHDVFTKEVLRRA